MKRIKSIYISIVICFCFQIKGTPVFALNVPNETEKASYEKLINEVEKEFLTILGEQYPLNEERRKDKDRNIQFMLQVGESLEESGHLDAAFYQYQKLITIYPDDPFMIDRMYVFTASAYEKANRYQDALKTYMEYLQNYGDDKRIIKSSPAREMALGFRAKWVGYKSIAECYQKLGQYEKAIEYYDKKKDLISSELSKISDPNIKVKNIPSEKEYEYILYRDFNTQMDIADCYVGSKEYKKALDLYRACKQFIENNGYPKNWKKETIEHWKKDDTERLSKSMEECERKLSGKPK